MEINTTVELGSKVGRTPYEQQGMDFLYRHASVINTPQPSVARI